MGNDPDILVDLTTAKSDFEAQVIVESLRAQGIPAQAFTTAGTAIPLHVGSSLPFRIAVRRRDLAAANSALRAIRAESVDIDWDEVDVGEPEDPEPAATPAASSPRRRWRVVVAVTLYLLCAGALADPIYTAAMFLIDKYVPSLLEYWTPGWFFVTYLVFIGAVGCVVAAVARRKR